MANPKTKLTIGDYDVVVSRSPNKSPFKEFIIMNQAFFLVASRDPKIPAHIRARDLIIAKVDRMNYLYSLSPTMLSKELGVSLPTASRALAHLVEVGFLVKRGRSYTLSPSVGWKGSTEDHSAQLKLVRS